jgi:hypothetical protein
MRQMSGALPKGCTKHQTNTLMRPHEAIEAEVAAATWLVHHELFRTTTKNRTRAFKNPQNSVQFHIFHFLPLLAVYCCEHHYVCCHVPTLPKTIELHLEVEHVKLNLIPISALLNTVEILGTRTHQVQRWFQCWIPERCENMWCPSAPKHSVANSGSLSRGGTLHFCP